MNKKPIYIIEHLEPELFEWCLIEYENISKIVGKENLWFTNVGNKKKSDRKKLEKFGKVFSKSVKEMNLENACILDPESKKILKPKDNFDYYIFGGILGDYPPRKRTKNQLTKFLKAETRNISKEQMSTDNAVYTVKQIVEKGKNFNELNFVDNISVKLNEFESVELPYRYNLIKGKPLVSKKIKTYLRKKKGF